MTVIVAAPRESDREPLADEIERSNPRGDKRSRGRTKSAARRNAPESHEKFNGGTPSLGGTPPPLPAPPPPRRGSDKPERGLVIGRAFAGNAFFAFSRPAIAARSRINAARK